MSCNTRGLVGQVFNISQPTIVQGADAFVVAQVVYKGSGEAYGIEGFMGATAQFPGGADGASPVAVTGALVSADTGKLRFDLAAASTPSLQAGENLSFQVNLVDASGLLILVVEDSWSVREALF